MWFRFCCRQHKIWVFELFNFRHGLNAMKCNTRSAQRGAILITCIERFSPPKFKVSVTMLHSNKFATIQPYWPDLFLETFAIPSSQDFVSSLSECAPPHSLTFVSLKNNCTRKGCSENGFSASLSFDFSPVQTIVRL